MSNSYEIKAVHFPKHPLYKRLMQGFKKSVEQNSTHGKLELEIKTKDDLRSIQERRSEQSYKLSEWIKLYDSSKGGNIVFMDTDTLLLRDIGDAFNFAFDIAVTTHFNRRKPWFNGGVMFLRNNDRVRKFLEEWERLDIALTNNHHLRRRLSRRNEIPGHNQVSFVEVANNAKNINIIELPCHEWNCCNSSWLDFDPEVTRVLHVKSDFRNHVINDKHSLMGIPEEAIQIARKFLPLKKELTL